MTKIAEEAGAYAEMPAYICHKKVWALKIAAVKHGPTYYPDGCVATVHFVDENFAPRVFNLKGKPCPSAGWYFVQYEDGYESFSPESAFEKGYSRITASNQRQGQGIGWAVKQMQNGTRVRRSGWNGKGMFLFLVPGSTFKVNRPPLLGIYSEGTEIDYCPHVDMKTADGKVVPWTASQTDLLASDWETAN